MSGMTSVQFLTSHVRSTLGSNAFEPNQENKVLPVCQTPKQDDDEAISKMSVEEKTEEVLSDPKFGMFSLLAYHWYQGHKNAVLKRRNTVYCSHIFSSLFALPFLIFNAMGYVYCCYISSS